jgi:D-alanyl-lipoteichoic acid acyltransferase DltB (MBOAT superfamily)
MLFNSLEFPVFLLLVLTIHWSLKNLRHRNLFLLIASYFFYGWWSKIFLSLIIISSAVDYWCGLKLEICKLPRNRKLILAVSLVINLGILGTFKYLNFFVDNFEAFLTTVGFRPDWPTLNIILPVGISFYTFQTLSYTIDVYRRKIPACKSVVDFFLFVAFFPQLVAGPIERAVNLLPQIQNRRSFDENLAKIGLRHILWGFVLKSVLADNLAPIVDAAYGNIAQESALDLLLAAYFFAFQIYGDFAGYSHIAIGSAALLGIRLTQNFNSPYLALSVKEFWTRWHISLSSWFREYVYIFTLGGNRVSKYRHTLNILLTFLVSGFWHGANWTFIIWGLLHGIFYFLKKPFQKDHALACLGNFLVTFHLVCFGWIFFGPLPCNRQAKLSPGFSDSKT